MPATKLSVIVPATDAPPTLERCLDALRAGERVPDELIVITEARGAGPAAARNEGAARATGDVLVFVDADVLVAADALARIEAALDGEPGLAAVFGSYDDTPASPDPVSGFRNLLHHHVHHGSAGEVPTFWAGLGAVRRDAFAAAGGFDAARYPTASIEDIELGARLTAAGARIVLDPAIQGTHLKRWTLVSSVVTDFARRGVPWVELIARGEAPADVLNLGWRHRASAALALVAALLFARRRPLPSVAAIAAVVALNRDLYGLILRRRGPRQAATAVPLHLAHHLTSAAALVAGSVRAVGTPRR